MATEKLRKKLGVGRHLSAQKRDRQNKKRSLRNRQALSRMKTAVKKLQATPSQEALAQTVPLIAKTASQGIIPRRRASRLISRLTKAVNKVAPPKKVPAATPPT
jgi:small subunit ribosomal protein S20